MADQWTCPYCNRPCTIGGNDVRTMSGYNSISQEYGYYISTVTVIVCPNPDCRQHAIPLRIQKTNEQGRLYGKTLYSWNLMPESEAKPFPAYIPKALLEDYREACLTKKLSPKASATLSRRCLQGMIRDFWSIKKNKLVDAINDLQHKVDTTTWDAIDSVRKVGNIGAHLEKDVNLMIEVDPEEASLLIWLIETLLTDWYINRYEKEKRMKQLVEVAEQKTNQKKEIPRATSGENQ
ncbi:MAG: DUF4145 domain-containing protein [Candidatus Marinimicrobia bacterium]|nr:DUF4145 domain-containing protein [Candidatus Neomarinimicrobiota bacterium]